MGVTEPAARKRDLDVVRSLPFLHCVPDALRELVVGSFEIRSYGFGDYIVREGERGDGFYVLVEGMARALRVEADGAETTIGMLRAGESFGEEALLDDVPRAASIRISEPAAVARLDRSVFLALVELHPQLRDAFALQRRSRRLQAFLRTRQPFSELEPEQLGRLLVAAREVVLPAEHRLVSEGEQADLWWVVQDGRLTVFQERETRRNLRFLRSGDIFGEMSLVSDGRRTASIETASECTLLEFDRDIFDELMRDERFRARIDERRLVYEHAATLPLDFAEYAEADASPSEQGMTPEGARPDRAVASLEVTGGLEVAEQRPDAETQEAWRAPRHFPWRRQIDEADCGPTCIAMICRAFGEQVSHNAIRHAVGTSDSGTSLRGLQRGGEQIGLQVRVLKSSASRVTSLALPAVLHWEGNHWIVLYRVDGARAWIADPARSLRVVDHAELEQKWSGYAATFRPTERLAQAPRERLDTAWLWPMLARQRRRLAIVTVLATVVAAAEMVPPLLSNDVIDAVSSDQGAGRVNTLILVMVGVLLLAVALSLVQRRLLARVAVEVDSESLDFVTGRLLALPLSYFQARRTGDIERRLTGLRQLREIGVRMAPGALAAVVQLVATVVIMFSFSWVIGVAFLATIPMYGLLMRLSSTRLRPTFDSLEEAYARHASKQLDAIKGIEAVKTSGAEPGVRARVLSEFQRLAHQMFDADFALMSYGAVVQLAGFVVFVAFLWVSALLAVSGELSVGDVVAVNFLVLLANAPIAVLLGFWDQMQIASVLLQRLQDVLQAEAEQLTPRGRLHPVPVLGGQITLHQVGLRYRDTPDRPVLSDVSLQLEPGTSLGLVGRSGSGKSTLLRCLAGLLVPTSGQILFDGIDLRELRWDDLRRRIGFVLQASYLFDETIAGNIALGDEQPDMERVVRAAEMAAADEFIDQLPLGYATRVGDSGLHLSGGQAQRIAIARALYNDPPIILFDEATSALDTESERQVQENLRAVMASRTAVIVAHRLSTVREADLIGVLDHGRLVELGSHEELMRRQGLYFHLNAVQLPT